MVLSGACKEDATRPLADLERRLDACVGPHRVSFSVGVTEYNRQRHSAFEELLAEADSRMYEQKRAAS